MTGIQSSSRLQVSGYEGGVVSVCIAVADTVNCSALLGRFVDV